MSDRPDPARLAVKLFLRDGAAFDPDDAIPTFHRWIRDRTVPGVLIDVADYRHVRHGPVVVLVAHEGHYRLDHAEGRRGLEYELKRGATGDFGTRLTVALHRTLHACAALERERPDAARFRTDTIRIRIPDRLAAPNTPRTRDALAGHVTRAVRDVFDGAPPETVWEPDAATFTLTVRGRTRATAGQLAERLGPAGRTQ